MIPTIICSGFEPCILVGGPLDGKEDKIACIGPESPCDDKCFPYKDSIIWYEIKLLSPTERERVDGKWVLYYRKKKEYNEPINSKNI